MSAVRLLVRALAARFGSQRPFILSHLITARCNADCVTCLWKMPADSRTVELTTAEVEALYRDARAAGFAALVLWGGEPMVRPDTGAVLAAARAAGLETTLITNGWFLPDRADEVLPHTDRLILSVDALGSLHDEIRRCPGLFVRLDAGLAYARARYPRVRVTLLAVLSRQNRDALAAVVRYGAEHGAQIVVQAMNYSDYGFGDRRLDLERVRLSAAEEAAVAADIGRLRQRGYAVRGSQEYLDRLGPAAAAYRCHYKKVVLRVEPNGDVLDCTCEARPLTSVRSSSLAAFTRSATFREFVRRAEGCNRCRDAGVIEISHLWEGRLGAVCNAWRSLG